MRSARNLVAPILARGIRRFNNRLLAIILLLSFSDRVRDMQALLVQPLALIDPDTGLRETGVKEVREVVRDETVQRHEFELLEALFEDEPIFAGYGHAGFASETFSQGRTVSRRPDDDINWVFLTIVRYAVWCEGCDTGGCSID